jgi:hypothetical protein
MPQHVGVDSERHFGGRPKPRHHPAIADTGSLQIAVVVLDSGLLFD